MEVDESFCHDKNVSQRFPSSSVGQRVSWHWFELSCLEGRERIRLLLNRFAAALWSLNGVVLPLTHIVSCTEWTASSPVYCRTLSSFSSHLMHTMQVIVHCAQICAQPKMHNMLRTLLAHSLAHNTDWILQYSTKWISRFVVCYVSHLAHWAIQTELVFQTAH